jgi:uncharacterized protein YycO
VAEAALVAKLSTGDIILVRGHGPIERAIEFATTSPYSHAAMMTHRGDLVESKEFHGVRTVPANSYNGDWYTVACDAETKRVAEEFALAHLGQPYGWQDALDDGLRDLLHIRAGDTWRHWRHFDCSALIVAAYFHAGVVLSWRPVPAPADLAWSPLLRKLEETA